MNTLSRVDSYLFSLVSSPPPPAAAAPPLSNIQHEAGPAPTFTFPASNEPASTSSSVNTSLSPSSPSSPPPLGPAVRRRLPTRRRRRRHPTSSSIKVPPPTTPLLLRVALAIWSILLSFWRSLVGDTRAVRVLRHKKRTVTVAAVPVGAGAAPDRLAESPAAAVNATILGRGHPAASPASSDESASEHEWIDPVTRAPENGTPGDTDSEVEFRPRDPVPVVAAPMSIQLQSSLRKSGLDSKLDTKQPKFVTTVTAPTPRRSPRLLPNPMQTSLLDPSVPAVPHRSVSPTSTPAVRPQHTPFHLQKTLILDLDETLIHSTSRPMGASHSGTGMLGLGPGLFGGKRRREGHTIEVVLNGRSTTYHVYKRPYVDFFLKRVASWYTLVIYTASMPEYADPVIDWLDNGRGLFAKRLYRDACHLQPSGSYVKDLSLVDPDLSRVCFMDNSPISYSWNKANALPIEGWTSDPNDEALLHSIPVLDSLRFVTDVRRILGIRGFV